MNEQASGYVGSIQREKFNRNDVLEEIRKYLPESAYVAFSASSDSTLRTVERLVNATKAHHCHNEGVCQDELKVILHRAHAGLMASRRKTW